MPDDPIDPLDPLNEADSIQKELAELRQYKRDQELLAPLQAEIAALKAQAAPIARSGSGASAGRTRQQPQGYDLDDITPTAMKDPAKVKAAVSAILSGLAGQGVKITR